MKTISVDPKLPANFDNTPNDERPKSHKRWWYRPYVVTVKRETGTEYDVRCLDGGAWDRSTWIGTHTDLLTAIGAAREYAAALQDNLSGERR